MSGQGSLFYGGIDAVLKTAEKPLSGRIFVNVYSHHARVYFCSLLPDNPDRIITLAFLHRQRTENYAAFVIRLSEVFGPVNDFASLTKWLLAQKGNLRDC